MVVMMVVRQPWSNAHNTKHDASHVMSCCVCVLFPMTMTTITTHGWRHWQCQEQERRVCQASVGHSLTHRASVPKDDEKGDGHDTQLR